MEVCKREAAGKGDRGDEEMGKGAIEGERKGERKKREKEKRWRGRRVRLGTGRKGTERWG